MLKNCVQTTKKVQKITDLKGELQRGEIYPVEINTKPLQSATIWMHEHLQNITQVFKERSTRRFIKFDQHLPLVNYITQMDADVNYDKKKGKLILSPRVVRAIGPGEAPDKYTSHFTCLKELEKSQVLTKIPPREEYEKIIENHRKSKNVHVEISELIKQITNAYTNNTYFITHMNGDSVQTIRDYDFAEKNMLKYKRPRRIIIGKDIVALFEKGGRTKRILSDVSNLDEEYVEQLLFDDLRKKYSFLAKHLFDGEEKQYTEWGLDEEIRGNPNSLDKHIRGLLFDEELSLSIRPKYFSQSLEMYETPKGNIVLKDFGKETIKTYKGDEFFYNLLDTAYTGKTVDIQEIHRRILPLDFFNK